MDHFREQPKFKIRPVIEQKPFESRAVQSFFTEWCEINDSLQLKIISRDEWEKRRRENILERQPDGKLTLFIPKDLQLWEMIGVMEVVDRHTFADKPERQTEAKEKLRALAKIFQNAGIYIARRLESIPEGREIAEALAQEFYEYGKSLELGKRPKTKTSIEELANQNLTSEETETIDRFLAGDRLFESRRKRVGRATAQDPSKKEELYEKERQRTLAQFFRVAQKAFELKSKSIYGKLQRSKTELKPWQSDAPIHSAFLARVEKAIAQKIETPKRELNMAIFRRGLVKLVREMRKPETTMKERKGTFLKLKAAFGKLLTKLGFDSISRQQEKLVDALRIPELKAKLEEIRKTGNLTEISRMERIIADRIQIEVSKFPYEHFANYPSEMVAKQYLNCLGASILGGALMKEAGLNYLVGDLPGHSVLLLVTSDGNVEWRDMLDPYFNERLTDEIIEGRKKDGTPITVKDIVAFAQNPTPEGLRFYLKKVKKRIYWVEEGQGQYVTVFGPEYGQQIELLNNTCFILSELGFYEEAIEVCRQAVALDPNISSPYYNLGDTLLHLGRYDEAIEAYRRAIAIDPKFAMLYHGLGKTLSHLARYNEAVEAYQQAITLDPKFAYPYFDLGYAFYKLKRYKEAIESYQQFINLANKKEDSKLIKQAKKMIAKLRSKLKS